MEKYSSTTAAKLELAAGFIAREWQVIILHDVVSGQCSCLPRRDGTDCKHGNQGKHPRMGAGWYGAGLTTAGDVEQWLKVYPDANLGLLCGPASGFWALDVDPKNGGDVALAELERVHGQLPYTQAHRTGSGGRHLLFALPPDFMPGGSPGRLPKGLDVRGLGGQIVAPGSRTLIGDYSVTVEMTGPLPQAPAWLLDLIRPAAAPEYSAPSSAVDWAPSAADSARLRAYASSTIARACGDLANFIPPGRGTKSYAVACSLIELSNAPWAGVGRELVRAAYDQAAQIAMTYGGDYDMAEAATAWRQAEKHVGQRGREMPPEREVSGVLDLPPSGAGAGEWPLAVPLQRAPQGPPGMPEIVGSSLILSETNPSLSENPQVSASVPTPTPEGQAALDLWHAQRRETAVQAEMEKLEIRAEAKRRIDALTRSQHEAAKDELRAALLDARGLDAVPEPVPLVKGWLAMDTVARISGPPGSYKSFVILDIAGHVGRGMDWHGHRVHQGNVLVMVAEGASGVRLRRDAWEKVHGPMTGVTFLPVPVQTNGPRWAAFVELVRDEVKPALVILDTQARITVGVQENDAGDMGVFVDAVESLRRETGACVLLVHHTVGADGTKARGSTTVEGAVHTELFVKAGKGIRPQVVLSAGKQKDVAKVEEFALDMVSVELGEDVDGDPVTSLVPRLGINLSGGDGTAESMLNAVMRDIFHEARGGTKAEVWSVVRERKLMSRQTFYRVWNKLVTAGNMAMVTGTQSYRYVPVDERAGLVGVAAGGVKTTD